MSFVCSWHLSQKELRLSTPLSPLLGEQVGVKEREQGRVRDRDTEREDMRRKQRERQSAKPKEVRYFTPVAGADDGHVFKKRRCVPCSDTGHILCLSSRVVIQTAGRLPVRNGAPALQVEQGPSHGETPP